MTERRPGEGVEQTPAAGEAAAVELTALAAGAADANASNAAEAAATEARSEPAAGRSPILQEVFVDTDPTSAARTAAGAIAGGPTGTPGGRCDKGSVVAASAAERRRGLLAAAAAIRASSSTMLKFEVLLQRQLMADARGTATATDLTQALLLSIVVGSLYFQQMKIYTTETLHERIGQQQQEQQQP